MLRSTALTFAVGLHHLGDPLVAEAAAARLPRHDLRRGGGRQPINSVQARPVVRRRPIAALTFRAIIAVGFFLTFWTVRQPHGAALTAGGVVHLGEAEDRTTHRCRGDQGEPTRRSGPDRGARSSLRVAAGGPSASTDHAVRRHQPVRAATAAGRRRGSRSRSSLGAARRLRGASRLRQPVRDAVGGDVRWVRGVAARGAHAARSVST